jgi:hypothetical protein
LKADEEENRTHAHIPEELSAIAEFQFKNRLPTRTAAVRELLRRGTASSQN